MYMLSITGSACVCDRMLDSVLTSPGAVTQWNGAWDLNGIGWNSGCKRQC